MNLIWSLCLICLTGGLRAACARPVRKTSKKNNAAPQEEANVLMFGVLQFSDSLKYISQTTEAKMVQIGQTLKNHEGTLQRLGRHTEEATKIKKQIQAVVMLLQTQMAEQQVETEVTKNRLANLEQDDVELMANVKTLETHLNNYVATSSIKELQDQAKGHSEALKGLQDFIQFQKESITSQSETLSKLQEMIHSRVVLNAK